MKDFLAKQEYERKLVSAEEAVSHIQDGEIVQFSPFVFRTPEIERALAARVNDFSDLKLECSGLLGPTALFDADPNSEHFVFHDQSFTAATRQMVRSGYTIHRKQLTYHEGIYYQEKTAPAQTIFISVTPMDDNGYFNLGCCGSIILDFIRVNGPNRMKVIAEINPNMPYVYGDNYVHVSRVDWIVENSNPEPLAILPPAVPTEVDKKIASLLLPEIPDGACLQLGIGGLPNIIGEEIVNSDLKNLGCHTEMFVDAYLKLYRAGKLTNDAKNFHRGYSLFTFAMGSRELYDFADHNPGLMCMPGSYTNKMENIALNDNLISINSCLNVDLFGEVSSETVGFTQISSTGGQLDFHFASLKSNGGKGFLCLPSTKTNKDGTVESRIVSTFRPGTTTTIPSTVTNYVVTEYGIALLKGRSLWRKVESLINIAHPDFRDQLIAEADKHGIWRRSNKR